MENLPIDIRECKPLSRVGEEGFSGRYPYCIGYSVDLEKDKVSVVEYDPLALAIRKSVHKFSNGEIAGHEVISHFQETFEFGVEVRKLEDYYVELNLAKEVA